MTTFRIPKSWHHSLPPSIGVFRKRRSFRKAVVFHPSCRYHIEGIDYFDINKLWGVGFFCGGHHVDSARFGWRYSRNIDMISLYAYAYVDGERIAHHITDVPLGREVETDLTLALGSYWFEVKNPHSPLRRTYLVNIPFTHNKRWAYALGPYFGGNKTATNHISVTLKNLPHD
jgi:hypothetical protein